MFITFDDNNSTIQMESAIRKIHRQMDELRRAPSHSLDTDDIERMLASHTRYLRRVLKELDSIKQMNVVSSDTLYNTFFVLIGLKPMIMDDTDMFFMRITTDPSIPGKDVDEPVDIEADRLGDEKYLETYRRQDLKYIYDHLSPDIKQYVGLAITNYYVIYNKVVVSPDDIKTGSDARFGSLFGFICPGEVGSKYNYSIELVGSLGRPHQQLTAQQCKQDEYEKIQKYYSVWDTALRLAGSKKRIVVVKEDLEDSGDSDG